MPLKKYSDGMKLAMSGTFCSGKDTAAEYLVRERGFLHISTGDILREEALSQGRDLARPTLVEVAVDLRQRHGGNLGILATKAVEQWEESKAEFAGGLILTGHLIVAEVKEIQSQGGRSVFVDGPVGLRFEREIKRAEEGDVVHEVSGSLEEFMNNEQAESYGLGGPGTPNLRENEAISDLIIWNDCLTKGLYYRQLDAALCQPEVIVL